ncbi:MAG: DUF5618 family protein [Saprospiraceae bacterium]|nr:DUF5618 family protein [Saprospiraceae bacterium]
MTESIKEANRYLSNAKELLSEKANRTNGVYQDAKSVKMAGYTAYCGVLFALDLMIKQPKKNKRKSVEYYGEFLSKYDKKMLTEFNNLYDTLHLSLGYDGNTDVRISKVGLEMAKEFIAKVATRLN